MPLSRALLPLVALAAVAAAAAPAHAERVVAVAPFSTLGAQDTSAGTRKLTAEIEQALAALPGTKVVSVEQVAEAIARAKKPQLLACEGDASCLAELGKLVGAQIVVTGEVGGLGASQVVYLGATDVATARELRSTTLAVGAQDASGGVTGAAIRLLEPEQYKGTIHFAIDAPGASVFVNGAKVQLSPQGNLALPVGTQAIRVTHPEYHDFVRFVDVPYGKSVELTVGLQQYPIVERNVRGAPTSRDKIEVIEPPLWQRWYVTGPAAVGAAILAGVLVYSLESALSSPSCSTPECTCHRVGGGPC